jgi:hypothetical protein
MIINFTKSSMNKKYNGGRHLTLIIKVLLIVLDGLEKQVSIINLFNLNSNAFYVSKP